jgi:hypothetical protein
MTTSDFVDFIDNAATPPIPTRASQSGDEREEDNGGYDSDDSGYKSNAPDTYTKRVVWLKPDGEIMIRRLTFNSRTRTIVNPIDS